MSDNYPSLCVIDGVSEKQQQASAKNLNKIMIRVLISKQKNFIFKHLLPLQLHK